MDCKFELKEKIKKECVKYGNFTLRSGQKSSVFVEMSKLIFSSEGNKLISECLYNKIIDINKMKNIVGKITTIGCTSHNGLQMASGLQMFTSINHIEEMSILYVKDSIDTYGTKTDVCGKINRNDNIVIITDVNTTDTSIIKIIKEIKYFDSNIIGIVPIVNRNKDSSNYFKKIDILYSPLFELEELIEKRDK